MLPFAPNAPEAVEARIRSGKILGAGVVLVCFARLVLALLTHGATVAVLGGLGAPDPAEEAARWFTVTGTFIDLGTLALLWILLRREGLSLADLFRAGRDRSVARSLAWAPVYLVGLGMVGFAAGSLTGLVVYGDASPRPPTAALPLWAGLYSTLVWPLVWGFTEEAAYNGYAVPRIGAISRSRWALALVCLGWAAQHVALPFRPDLAHAAYRFFPSLAVTVAAIAIYLRTRNLLGLSVAHWAVDAATGALTLAPPPG